MKSSRQKRLQEIKEYIGERQLIWFGNRGTDVQPLLEFEQLKESFSVILPLGSSKLDTEVCLETLCQRRVDMDNYNIDLDGSVENQELHRRLLRACEAPSVLVTYRPTAALASIYFSRARSVEYLGLFHELQDVFDHKPWVETELQREGIPVMPWRYVSNEDLTFVANSLTQGTQVLRANRSGGGAGLRIIRDLSELYQSWPTQGLSFFAIAPYLEPSISLNIHGCVFGDGQITLHAPSVQLIGIRCCRGRSFGYCGNDFARVRDLDRKVLDSLESITIGAGQWLRRMGYIGAFGVDAILHEDEVYLTEINPRFQGSSTLASQLAAQMDLPDIWCDHIASFLGLDAPPQVHVRDLAQEQQAVAQVIAFNRMSSAVKRRSHEQLDDLELMPQQLPAPDVSVEPEGILFKVITDGPVTEDGYQLINGNDSKIEMLVQKLFSENL
jgi:hypothetical protein